MLQKLRNNDERGVSPVIGVILMVAITVILAAVIASFVLGLGDADDPAPNPTVDTDFSSDELEVAFDGGDDFDADVATVSLDITVDDTEEDDDGPEEASVSYDITEEDEEFQDEYDDVGFDETDSAITFDGVGDIDEVSAGDSFTVSLSEEAVEDDDIVISEWDIEVIWDPADQDSEIIVSESGSN